MGVDKIQEVYREKQAKEPPQFVDNLFTARVGGTKKEIVSIHIGGAGVKMGSSMWELYCLEHGIGKDGTMPEEKITDDNFGRQAIFEELKRGKYQPRAMFCDGDPDMY